MRSFQKALVGFNNLWIHFLFLYSLIVCLCLKYLVCPSKWRFELGVWEAVFFPVLEEIAYCFFNFLSDIFWPMYHSLEKRIWFTCQRESHSVPDMDFLVIPSLILSHLELPRIELSKLTSIIIMESAHNCPWPAHKSSAFRKNYLWTILSLS